MGTKILRDTLGKEKKGIENDGKYENRYNTRQEMNETEIYIF